MENTCDKKNRYSDRVPDRGKSECGAEDYREDRDKDTWMAITSRKLFSQRYRDRDCWAKHNDEWGEQDEKHDQEA
jgi:hypothetical protein